VSLLGHRLTANETEVIKQALLDYSSALEKKAHATRSERILNDCRWRKHQCYELLQQLAAR